ncbi:bifunctional DNA-formamidopyrimidine glycosylase/DNA-(apurinic or apyrimidinic site) lyase [Candidatus Gottesmanbacteria bacterium]|nr:bifunctional DNA-formamidopyrimidine glycosylase/DNA-(apurinic or apyrimidinic site) lyase [Candidatus Gottesmanbacteria bacterium]
MPELPEVETIRLQLQKVLVGEKIAATYILSDRSFQGDAKHLEGTTIKGVRRFGKMIAIDFENGYALVVHLKMTGQLLFQITDNSKQKTDLPNKHTRVIIQFHSGGKLFFNDQRKFGWMRIVSINKEQGTKNGLNTLDNLLENLGPDPLHELNAEKLYKILQTSKRPVKLVLMDQRKISGVGNIYANDALYLSGIHPRTFGNQLSHKQGKNLYRNLVKVLKSGIKWKGASRQHFRDIYGQKGQVQDHFLVYERTGQVCPQGHKHIQKFQLGGRGTYFCPQCQIR